MLGYLINPALNRRSSHPSDLSNYWIRHAKCQWYAVTIIFHSPPCLTQNVRRYFGFYNSEVTRTMIAIACKVLVCELAYRSLLFKVIPEGSVKHLHKLSISSFFKSGSLESKRQECEYY